MLYCRQLAWLRAVPQGSKLSRWEETKAANGELFLPDLENSSYLIHLLDAAGTCSSTGMGLVGLSWEEIKGWIDCMGVEISYWEISMIKEMSREYAAQASVSAERNCKSPYLMDKAVKTEKAVIARSTEIANMFRKYKKET